jgi:hypothetical protein
MMNGSDEDAAAAKAIEDGVGSTADNEFAQVGFACGVAESGLEAKGLNKGDDAGG